MLNNRLYFSWQEHLWCNTVDIPGIGVGYGLGGNLFYYLMLDKMYANQQSQLYIQATIDEIHLRISKNDLSYPDLVELYFLLGVFKAELTGLYDISDFMNQLNQLLLNITHLLILENKNAPYLGSFNFGYISLALGLNADLVKKLISLIKDDFAMQKMDGCRHFRYSDSITLGLAHGSAFYLKFLSLCMERQFLTQDEAFLLEEQCCYILNGLTDLKPGNFQSGENAVLNEPRNFNICYGDYGIIYALIMAQMHLTTDITQYIKTLLTQQFTNDNLNGFGLLYGYSGVELVSLLIKKMGFTPSNTEIIEMGYVKELKLVEDSTKYEHLNKSRNFFEGITGCLILSLAKKTDYLTPIKGLLNLL